MAGFGGTVMVATKLFEEVLISTTVNDRFASCTYALASKFVEPLTEVFTATAPGRMKRKKCLAATYFAELVRRVELVSVCAPTGFPSDTCQYTHALCRPVVRAW